MVEIVHDTVKVFSESIIPAIQLEIIEELDDDTILLKVEGFVLTEDQKYITNIVESTFDSAGHSYISKTNEVDKGIGKTKSKRKIMFTLDKKALDHLEEQRQKSKNKDVVLELLLNLAYLKHSAKLGKFFEFSHEGANIIASTPQVNTGNNNLRILVNDDLTNTLLLYHTVSVGKKLTIKASDWVNDYQEALGIGKFLLVEVPVPELKALRNVTLSPEHEDFMNRLNKAYQTIEEMEAKLRDGEWGTVVSKLRVNVTKFIKKMIGETTSLEEDKAGDLTVAIEKLRSYASELHHVVGSQGVKEVYTGGKEDAYMAYMLAASLTNLLARKFSKIVSLSQTH